MEKSNSKAQPVTKDEKPVQAFDSKPPPPPNRHVLRAIWSAKRREARQMERMVHRATEANKPADKATFICPKCHAGYETAEDRNACKALHREAAAKEADEAARAKVRAMEERLNVPAGAVVFALPGFPEPSDTVPCVVDPGGPVSGGEPGKKAPPPALAFEETTEQEDARRLREVRDLGVWRTADGDLIALPHLTDRHLQNIIRMYRENRPPFPGPLADAIAKPLIEEGARRGLTELPANGLFDDEDMWGSEDYSDEERKLLEETDPAKAALIRAAEDHIVNGTGEGTPVGFLSDRGTEEP